MIDISQAIIRATDDMQSIKEWVKAQYDSIFSEYFEDIRSLTKRMSSKTSPITDEELEIILIDLPLKLIGAAEKINDITLCLEVIKLRNKKQLTEKIKSSEESTSSMKKDVAESEMFEEKVLELAYSSLLDRVQKEVSYSRELIMGAKKVWDSRRKTDSVNPVSEVDPKTKGQTPIYT